MKTIIAFFLFFISVKAFTQNYIPINYTNAKFHSTEYIGYIPCDIDKLYKHLNDTILAGKTYHVFQTQILGSFPANCIAPGIALSYYRNDSINKKVYIYWNNQDTLNYDFSLMPGDTSKAYHDGYNIFQNAPVVLISIDSALVNNIWHRRFNYLQYDGLFNQYTHTIIEGIGATYLHFFENAASLRCYSLNNNIIYQDGNYLCEIPLKLSESLHSEPQINIDNQLHITGFKGLLEIYDIQGRSILKEHIDEIYNKEILHLAKGVILLRLSNNDRVFVKKICIKE